MFSLLFASPRRLASHRFKRRAPFRLPHVALGAALLLSCLGLPARADTPDEQWQFATGLYSQKLWSLAAENLGKFVKAFPSHARAKLASYQLGGALYRAANDRGEIDYAAAAAAYERAIARYPDPKLSALARFELGDALFNLKKYEAAIAAQTAFLKSNPAAAQAAQAQYWIGESLYALNKKAPARAAYQTVLTKYPKSDVAPYASYSLGLLAFDETRFSDAASAFKTVWVKFPASDVAPESRFRMAEALLSARQFGAARDAYRATIEDTRATEWKSDALLGLADAQFGAKAWNDAASAYRTALAALKVDDARRNAAQLSLGDSFFNAKNYAQALEAYAPLQSGDAKTAPAALYFSGNALRALNRFDEAAKAYRAVLERFGSHSLASRAALRLGDALADARDTAGAAQAYRIVITKYKNSDAAKEAEQALVALVSDVAASDGNGTNSGNSGTTQTTVSDANGSGTSGSDALEQVLRALPAGPATSNAQLQLAQAAFARADWTRAAALAQSALAGKPDTATAENALYLLASSRLRAGKLTEATSAFQKQLAQSPRGALATQGRLGLAWSLLDAKKWTEAASAARLAATPSSPVRDEAHLAWGEALLRGGKPKEALTAFSIAQKSKDKDSASHGAAGAALSLEAQRQWTSAAARWSQLAALSPDAPARARAYLQQGLALAKSIGASASTTKIAPGVANANGTASLAAFDRAVAADPKGAVAAQALYESAWVAHDLKRTSDKAARWARLSRDFPDSPQAREADFQSGEALFAAKKWDEAAVAYRRVVERPASPVTPNVSKNVTTEGDVAPFAWYKLGSALYQSQKWSDAAPAFDSAAAFSQSETAVESSFWAGESWRRAGDNSRARTRYETFLKAASTNKKSATIKNLLPAARLGSGQALAAQNDWAGAAAAYRAGLNGAKGNVAGELNFRLGEALEKTNQSKEAVTQYLKVVTVYPSSEWVPQAKERLEALGTPLPK